MRPLKELTEEMLAVRHELLDEHPVMAERVQGLIEELESFTDWLREQHRLNRCVRVQEPPQKERTLDPPIGFVSPDVQREWVERGWL